MRDYNTAQRSLICTGMLLWVASFLLGQKDMANSGTWSGVLVNSDCSADEAFAEATKCTESRGLGAKLALYDDTVRQVYALEPPDRATGHVGDSVTVHGTLQGNVIHVASIGTFTIIGLSVGQKAPTFSALDQFGREQNLDTLKGQNGTVLLFFRSADW